jgi:hypothetical protein
MRVQSATCGSGTRPGEDTYTFSSLSGLALLESCARVIVSATQASVIADFEY